MRILLSLWFATLIAVTARAESESLGDQLLDDLDPGMFAPSAELDPRDPELRFRPPRRGDEGSDIGSPAGGAPLPLVRVRQAMQMAKLLLAEEGAIADARDVQGQVVAELDALIAELERQCRGGGSGDSSGQPPPSERSQADAPQPGATPGRGQTAARDSTNRLGSTTVQPADPAALEDLVKDLWGHLPARSREQLLQSFSDEFLPKYQLEIEQYYRRLSEDEAESEVR